jgi:pimeloyl-ACP methyl ester carboxylesterase
MSGIPGFGLSRAYRLPVAAAVLASITLAGTASAQSHIDGAIGPGSLYEIDVPAVWNGSLVLYAHGIVQADQPVMLPSEQDQFDSIRATLLAAGYAVAASSYSSNGWALADAVRRTHQLKGIFTSKVGRPQRIYLAGHSLGALAVVKLAEQFAGQYDGALAMCGPLGGAVQELQHAGDARVTFDYYFPGLLPGTPFSVPEGVVFGPAAGGLFDAVLAAFFANPDKLLMWATAAKLPFSNQQELVASALYTVGFVLAYTNDFVERVNGKTPFDNRHTLYEVTFTGNPVLDAILSAQLNAGVERFDADRAAVNYYERNYTPSGAIGIPVLTLHTVRDPGIPFVHEELFAAAVQAAGRSDLLVQRSVDRWGHCAFTPQEMLTAFGQLVQWVETGQRP